MSLNQANAIIYITVALHSSFFTSHAFFLTLEYNTRQKKKQLGTLATNMKA